MIYKGRTYNWPPHAEEMIYRVLQDTNIYIGQSINAECLIAKSMIMKLDFVLIYHETRDVFIVWNTCIHQKLHAGERVKLLVGSYNLTEGATDDIVFASRYYNGTNGQNNGTEYVAVIQPNGLYDFFNNISYYNTFFSGDGCDPSMDSFQRKLDAVIRKRRDPQFRNRILAKYGGTCAVCGESERVMLEAAHITSVSDGGNDDIENGICLCANHHKLYDNALLDINLDKGTFCCRSDKCKHTPWYLEAKKRNFKLLGG